MMLCDCDSNGECSRCGTPRKNCNSKRVCPASGVRRMPPDPPPPVGTVLSKIIPFTPTSGCSCKSLQKTMDILGPSGCWRHLTWLSAAVSKNAKKLGYYCPRLAAAFLIAAAIFLARISHSQKRRMPTCKPKQPAKNQQRTVNLAP